MKKYKLAHKPFIYILLIVGFILAVIGLIWNIFNIVSYININKSKTLSYIIICLLNLIIAAFIFSITFFSSYYIKNDYLCCAFGFYVVKEKIANIEEVINFTNKNKLAVYFKDGRYSVIIISPSEYDEFIANLLKSNKNICYSIEVKGK